jgi:hypothetical protein
VEELRIKVAVTILIFTGAVMIYQAASPDFHVPDAFWGIATAASLYFFTSNSKDHDDHE